MNGIVSNGESYKPSSGSHGEKIMNALNKLNINAVASKSMKFSILTKKVTAHITQTRRCTREKKYVWLLF